MLPRQPIDQFTTPGGNVFRLIKHDQDFYIEIDGQELMSTRRTGSEVALAEFGCAGLEDVERPRVLIGGLGLGFTLRAALERLPRNARLVVADLFPKVVEWNRDYLGSLYGETLEDPRLEIVVCDVWEQIAQGPWDAILLDTDNGPDFFCLPSNDRLYDRRGLHTTHDALADGGTLTVWSTDAQPSFVKRLRRAGFEARCERVRERGNKGQSYAIYVAEKLPESKRKASQGQRNTQSKQRSPKKDRGQSSPWSQASRSPAKGKRRRR